MGTQKDHLWPYVTQVMDRDPDREWTLPRLAQEIRKTTKRDVPLKSLSRLMKRKADDGLVGRHSVTLPLQTAEIRRCFVYYRHPKGEPVPKVDWGEARRIVCAAIKTAQQERREIINRDRYRESDEVWQSSTDRRMGIPEHHILWEDVALLALAELRAVPGSKRKEKANEVLTTIRRSLAESFEIEAYFLKDPESRQVSQTGTYSITVPTREQREQLKRLNKDSDWGKAKQAIVTHQEQYLNRSQQAETD